MEVESPRRPLLTYTEREREREREGRSQPASRTLALPILLKWEPFELRAHLQTEARSSKSGL